MDASWKVKGAWNNDTEELKLYKASAKFPFGKVEANGNLKLRTGEIANFHMTGEDMVLEDLLTHWPGLENALPFHIGFSGPSQWALSGDGTLDHLSLHLNWDLTRALLTYAQYFSKAKDVPLDLGVDCLIQKGETLSGDFSIRFQDMSLKGNLSNLDVRTGHGQLNLITNKFNVDGWEKYIPLLQQDKIGGGLKFLGNWKGDLRKLEKAERIFNVTVEKGSWTTAEGLGLRQASFSLDYSPLMLEGRQMQFEAGDSTVTADLKISGSGDKAQAEWKLIAEEFKPGKAWQSIAALGQRRSAGTEGDFYAPVSDMMADFFPGEERLKKFAAEGRYRDKRWDISNLQFVGYNGQVSMKGTVQVKDQEPWYRCEGEIHGLDLGRFLGRHEANRKAVEGILTLKGSWEGKGWGQEAVSRSFSGQGDLSLINATCVNFDLREELATINPLSGISNVLPSMNHFDEVDLRWKLNAGKFTTDDLLMRHNDYVVDGEGTLGLDGLANFRMEVFLSSAVAARLLPGMAASLRAEPRAHLGPIPVLLSGPLTSPELKLDPAQVAGIRDKIIRGKTGEILVELVLQ